MLTPLNSTVVGGEIPPFRFRRATVPEAEADWLGPTACIVDYS